MSKKQLGAAPGEENEPQAGERLGWFGRLRAQPGFRTASIAFVLTVVLGIGSTAAYAYWSQKNTVTQTVTTVRQPLPVITGKGPQCGWSSIPGLSNVMMSQPSRPAVLPSGAAVIMDVDYPGGRRSYFLKQDGAVRLIELPGLEKLLRDIRGWELPLSFTITTAYLSTPVPTEHLKDVSDAVSARALQAPSPEKAYYYASFTCNRL